MLRSRLAKRAGLLLASLFAATIVGIYADLLPGRTWYLVRGLCRATNEPDRDVWIARLQGVPAHSLFPHLRNRLQSADSQVCENVTKALEEMAGRAGGLTLVTSGLADAFPRMSTSGQRVTLRLFNTVARNAGQPEASADGRQATETLAEVAAKLIQSASVVADRSVRAEALSFAADLSRQTTRSDMREACRTLVKTCLRDEAMETRLCAVRLAMRPDIDLHEEVAPLLSDPDPEIRKVVMLAVGPVPEAVSTDELLRWLHDPDEDVRRLCETALRGRGLQELHLRLGKHLTDATPWTRLKVLDLLSQANDLEPSAWIRRLSHDPSPAVRAAAVRAATERPQVDIRDRVVQMSQSDPSTTIRQLATYYLAARHQTER